MEREAVIAKAMGEDNDPKRRAAIELVLSVSEGEGGVPFDLPKPISVKGLNNSRFPERGGNRIPSVKELVDAQGSDNVGQPK